MTYDPTKSLGARLHAASRAALGHTDPIGISNFPRLPPADQTYWERTAVNFVARLSDAPTLTGGAEIRNALRVALSFLEGFEGDELQEGIDERIDTVRSALKAAEALS